MDERQAQCGDDDGDFCPVQEGALVGVVHLGLHAHRDHDGLVVDAQSRLRPVEGFGEKKAIKFLV